jgi:hypothetical protein
VNHFLTCFSVGHLPYSVMFICECLQHSKIIIMLMKYILLGNWGVRYADDLFFIHCYKWHFFRIYQHSPKIDLCFRTSNVECNELFRYNYYWLQEPYSILHFQKTHDNRHYYYVVVWFMFPVLPHSQIQILCCWVFMYLISIMNFYFIHPNEI